MRAFVAILTLCLWPVCVRAFHVPPALLAALRIEGTPAEKLVTCGQTLGPAKCLTALSAWRAADAVDHLVTNKDRIFNLTEDVERFPWQKYANTSDDQIYSELCDGAEKLLQYRSLKLKVAGYSFQLNSRANGALNVDVYSVPDDDVGSARSTMKKYKQQFYKIVPLLLVPGLIMSAILPFMLPALKMMVMGTVMLNNMALTSAVFTLLRNNAFNDNYYHKRIIYTNDGYRNKPLEQEEPESHNYEVAGNFEEIHNGEDFNIVEEPNQQWMVEFLGHEDKFVNTHGYRNRRIGHKKRKKNRHRRNKIVNYIR